MAPLFIEVTKSLNPYVTSINKDIATYCSQSHNSQSKPTPWVKRGRSGLNISAITSTRKYCTLCGKTGHQADDVCYSMKNDRGEIVRVVPSFTACEICKTKKQQAAVSSTRILSIETSSKAAEKLTSWGLI